MGKAVSDRIFPIPTHKPNRFWSVPRERSLRRAVRASFGIAALVPSLAERWAEFLFRTPPRRTPSSAERRALAAGQLSWMALRGERLATWTFGEGPAILAFHGWGGHAGRLSRFFPALVRAGFSVVAVDAPGHGASSGSRVSLPDFVAAVEAVTEANGPVAGAIGHSAGAAAIALAIRRGAPIRRAVLLAPPAEPEHYAAKFAVHFGIPAQVREGMKRRLGQRYGMEWSDLRLTGATEKPSDLLVFHDRRDQSVPWRDGAALVSASPGARLITTEGLGHHKILRDRRVVAETARFFASGAIPRMPVPMPMDAVPVAALSGAAS